MKTTTATTGDSDG
ncbi:mucin-associated surface protein (MASP), putative, partial [Trypanosoma cruzi]